MSKTVKPAKKANPTLTARIQLFQQMEALYGIPWTYLAAIDQYERTIKKRGSKTSKAKSDRLTAISIPPAMWSGSLNPEEDDQDESSIFFFGGMGKDGTGDGKADPSNDLDALHSIIHYLTDYGFSTEDFSIALWNYYKRDRAVQTIKQFAKIYDKYQELDLVKHSFPIPKRYDYSYNNTWGEARGWGGIRIHEGTDIFADYGTPVLSTSYGIVEIIGWNRFGGWRVGIRDLDNIYHYFAHLSSFKKGLKSGDIVEPGQVIGYVGSSGYGRPGTSGKFPPHLHYGMYRDTGSDEWSFNPYSYLIQWERQSSGK
ncbi:M23 family metallopeptidase [Brevibacillus ginsengisoli]|uniref:M23 family metallopeptidase n=1 Tax=Brevibacillus ginsengisoli TaxID=363854 RepID=UPI003CF1F05F